MPATISGLTQALADQSSRYESYSSVETRALNSSSSCHFDMSSSLQEVAGLLDAWMGMGQGATAFVQGS